MKITTFIRKLLDEIDKQNSWGKRQLRDLIMDLMLTNDTEGDI
jgi:hypothetical protein